jgi:hypothetical protein
LVFQASVARTVVIGGLGCTFGAVLVAFIWHDCTSSEKSRFRQRELMGTKIRAAFRKQLYHWNSTRRIVIKWGSAAE